MTRGIKRRRRARRERKREMPRRYYYDVKDGNPWKQWACRDEHPHAIRLDDSGRSDEQRDVCLYCGLNVVKDEERSFVEGYHLHGSVFADLESARAFGDAALKAMVGEVRRDIGELCQNIGVTRLDMFGSVVTGLSRPDSDVDILVEFDNPDRVSFKRYMGLKKGLERIFGREVDLVEDRLVRNKYFKQVLERDKRNIYAS